jgi:type II secretory pathway pseudopilin PulG
MHLHGQEPRAREQGYAMAVLLVAMSVMAVMMTVVMPVWRQTTQREKEEELVFRGKQYARAIGLFGRKYANASPPTIDVLLNEHFLRKKYKDPITNDDFVPVLAGQNVPGTAAPGTPQQGGRGTPGIVTGISAPQVVARGGIVGVTSKSKDKSIRLYNGRGHYNEWAFVYLPPVATPGAGAPGTTAPGQPGRGQRGQPGQQQPGGPFGGQRGQGDQRGGPGRGPGGGFGNPNGPGGGRGPGNPGGFNPFQPVPPGPNTPPPRGR